VELDALTQQTLEGAALIQLEALAQHHQSASVQQPLEQTVVI
jgi:hypothetical protein